MLTYILYTLVVVVTYLFIMLNGHRVISNQVMVKYQKFRTLNRMVSVRQKNLYIVLWIIFKMILQALYIIFLQYINKSITRINLTTYEVTYVIDGKMYKMLVTPQRGPAPILLISNEEYEDVTTAVLP
jgi:hypothetical protein